MDLASVAKLTVVQLAALIALFLPGFVSIRVDRLTQPGEAAKAPELIVEAFAYSLINAVLLGWPVQRAIAELGRASPDYLLIWFLGVLILILGPSLWPLLFRAAQGFAARHGWLLRPHRSAWDEFFLHKRPYWIILHLSDGGLVGGYFGRDSAASLAPFSGHIYLEELWRLDDQGRFVERKTRSKGGLFRPGDYLWVELIADEVSDGQGTP